MIQINNPNINPIILNSINTYLKTQIPDDELVMDSVLGHMISRVNKDRYVPVKSLEGILATDLDNALEAYFKSPGKGDVVKRAYYLGPQVSVNSGEVYIFLRDCWSVVVVLYLLLKIY